MPDKKTSYIAASERKTDFAPCIMREKTLSATNSLSGCLTVHGKISYRFYHHHYHDHHNDDDDHHPSQSSQFGFIAWNNSISYTLWIFFRVHLPSFYTRNTFVEFRVGRLTKFTIKAICITDSTSFLWDYIVPIYRLFGR